ncbi:MAG: hypothetical protein L6Q95_16215 [Planctomycetes bacterium]|nr:hypothetical protein [Planctomycetota bacterium]
MLRFILPAALLLCALELRAGDSPGADAPAVTVPTFANANCPIMGKKASLKLFVDTPKGRIYMCCVKCAKEIRKDPDRAHAAAYPKIEKATNTVCPVTGEKIPEKDVPTVVLQGYEIPLCCKDCEEDARKNSQITLVKATNPKAKDIGNQACPVTGKPVAPNAFVLIGDDIVRLSSPECVEAVKKDPAAALKKAKELAASGAKGEPGKEHGEGHDDHGGHGAHEDDDDHGGHGDDHGHQGHGDHGQ